MITEISDIRQRRYFYDANTLENAMQSCNTVIHFTGLKAVGKSIEKELEYYNDDVCRTPVKKSQRISLRI